jgi:hypothetical protein
MMTRDDIAKLSAAELDALVAMAVKERTQRSEPMPAEAPKEFEATFNPAWVVFLAGANTIVQFKHLGHGWVSIAIPPPERAHLASLFLHHSLMAVQPKAGETVPAPVPPSTGGGTVH